MGPEVVVITGGHLEGKATDLYFDGTFHLVEGERIKGEYHGTGCAFSSAVTALLAIGHTPFESVRKANEFVRKAMEKAHRPGGGMGLLNL
jgi:hydroxymethylpyrimidine/phosphomethylpyrimidine kinase